MSKAQPAKMTKAQKDIFERYQALGGTAFHHPRKGTISISGFPAIPVSEAIEKLRQAIPGLEAWQAKARSST